MSINTKHVAQVRNFGEATQSEGSVAEHIDWQRIKMKSLSSNNIHSTYLIRWRPTIGILRKAIDS